MKKQFNKKEVIFYFLLLIICLLLKMEREYLKDSLDGIIFIKQALFTFEKEQIIDNFIFLLPFFVQLFFVGKRLYFKLGHFQIRYKNRRRYLCHCFLDFIVVGSVFSILLILTHTLPYIYLYQIRFPITLSVIGYVFKIIVELLTFDLILVFLFLLMKRYSYCYLVLTIVFTILQQFYQRTYIPVISLFITDTFDMKICFLFGLLCILIYFIYTRMDMGGEMDEVKRN